MEVAFDKHNRNSWELSDHGASCPLMRGLSSCPVVLLKSTSLHVQSVVRGNADNKICNVNNNGKLPSLSKWLQLVGRQVVCFV